MTIQEAPIPGDREHEELRMLYCISIDEIAHLKRRQLNVTNYAVALYVVLVLVAKQVIIQPAASWKLVVLCLIAVVGAIAGLVAISQLQRLIGIRRNRLRAVREQFFSTAFHVAWNADTGDDILLSHRAVIIVGVILSVYLIGFDGTQALLEP